MARICGLCRKAPREGEGMEILRIREDDDMKATGIEELGLYGVCVECFDAHRQRMAEKLGIEVNAISLNQMR